MKPLLLLLTLTAMMPGLSLAAPAKPGPEFYRAFTMRLQKKGLFRVFMPNGQHQDVKFNFTFGEPLYREPIVNDLRWDPPKPEVLRSFWDRILFKDGSTLEIGGEKLPLTCVYIHGQDNRFSGRQGPLIPEFVFKVYLVANDFACQGPIRPGWPESGGREENWDTYIHYEVRDPTIMLPTEALVRYRWNESSAVWIDAGGQ